MNNLEIVINKDMRINAKAIYEKLFEGVLKKTRFNDWISKRIYEYGFVEGVDYYLILSSKKNVSRGGVSKQYLLTLDMAKELCMVEKTDIAKKIRQYFIECEKQLKNHDIIRKIGIESRHSLTDTIKELGINDEMHGFAFSNFTKLVYQKSGIDYVKTKNFRDTLNNEQLRVVDQYEKIIDSYLKLGFSYSKIKDQLPEFTRNLLEV